MKTTTQEILYTVIEDNGGGLSLYVFRGQQCIYAHDGYEFTPGQLSQDIAALDKGSDTSDWDGNTNDPQALWDEMEQFVTGYNTIASGGRGHHHIYPQAMGAAGKMEFYPALAEAIYIITSGADNREEAAETIDEIYCWLKNGDIHTDHAEALAAQWIEYTSAE